MTNPYLKKLKVLSNMDKAAIIYSRVKDYEIRAAMHDVLVKAAAPKKASSKKSSLIPPVGVQNAAKRGLAMRDAAPKSKKGGLTVKEASKQGISSGVARARQLASGRPVSIKTIKQMVSFFARMQGAYDKGGMKAKIAWLLWGGSAGKAWANKVAKQYDKNKSLSYSTEADLLEVRHNDWYQYLGSQQLPLTTGEYNFILKHNDYFSFGDVIVDSVTIYSQGIPKRIALIPISVAAGLLRVSRPLSLREAKFRGRIGKNFI